MNRVKFVLKNIFYNSNILRETRKINKDKYNKKMNNPIKIIKRQYHTANTEPNKKPNPNRNNIEIFVIISAILGQFYYMRKM